MAPMLQSDLTLLLDLSRMLSKLEDRGPEEIVQFHVHGQRMKDSERPCDRNPRFRLHIEQRFSSASLQLVARLLCLEGSQSRQ